MLPEDLIGQTLGHYRILEPLGYGGTSTVFLAQDIHLQRNVAVKVFQPGEGDPREFLRRFAREARVLAQLDHPHILPVYEYGEQNGIAYLVMPHMAGGSLRDRVHGKGPMPPEEVVQLINQVLNALQYAHDHGLIHRDIKPGNMLFKADGTLMLSDFGLVKVTRLDTLPSLEEASTITTQAITGTPDYMAPEQIAGHVTPASDIYALGIVLYEMLTGARPFKSENYVGLLMKHMYEQPRPLRTVNAAISRTLDAVVLRAMEKDPEKRYQQPLELRKALEEGITAQLAMDDVDEEEEQEEGGATSKLIDEMMTAEILPDDAVADGDDEDNVPTATLPSAATEEAEIQEPAEKDESSELSPVNVNEADTNITPSVLRKAPRSASKRASRAARKAARVASMQRKDADLVAALTPLATPVQKPSVQPVGVTSSPNRSAPEQPQPATPPTFNALTPDLADSPVADIETQEMAPAQDASSEIASKEASAETLATSKTSSSEDAEKVESSKIEATARDKASSSSSEKVLQAGESAPLITHVFPLPQRTRKPLVVSLSLFSIVLILGFGTFFAMRANNSPIQIQKTPIAGVQTPLATSTVAATATIAATEIPSPAVTPTATPLPVSTDCPAPGSANKANTPNLSSTGTNANAVYFVNDPVSSTATLRRYDVKTGQTTDISKMSGTVIQEAQLSEDEQWVLFVATIANRPQLRVVRMDGQGMQTLYCAPTNGTIYSSQWSISQSLIVFNATNTSTAPAAPMTFLMNVTAGTLTVAVQPSGKLSVRPIVWLNDTQIYMMQENHASPSTPLQNIYLYDINQGANQSINSLKKLATVSTKVCASFDTSISGSQLFVSTCTNPGSGQQAPSKITSQPAAGSSSTTIYTDPNLIITTLRTASTNTLLLIAQSASDLSKNALYTINTDGSGLKQLTTPDSGTLESVNEFSQYTWSNVSRDKTLYAVESLSQGNAKLFFGSLDGTKPPKQFASATGTSLKLIGWTVI